MKKINILLITLLTLIGTSIVPVYIYAEDDDQSEITENQEPGEIQDEEIQSSENDVQVPTNIEENVLSDEENNEEILLSLDNELEEEPTIELALVFVLLMFIPFLVAMLR